MLTLPRFLQIAETAHTTIAAFSSTTGASPRTLLSPFPNRRPMWATMFAQMSADMTVTQWRRLPLPNFASWLVLLPKPCVAVDRAQIGAWCEKPTNLCSVHPDLQITRAIIHEVGHKLLHPRLAAAGIGAAPTATPEEEEEATTFAMTTVAVVMGDSAWLNRTRSQGDDSPSMPI